MAHLKRKQLEFAYSHAKKEAEEKFKPFDEYERIDRNKPRDDLPEHYPLVTDGTLSSLNYERPLRILGQLQTGSFVQLPTENDRLEDWKVEIINIIWANEVIKKANSQLPFIIKIRKALHNAGRYGSQPAYIFPVSNSHYTGSDFILPKIRDVYLEPGKSSDLDSDYIWMNSHYTILQLEDLLESLKKHKNGWDKNKLKAILEKYKQDEKKMFTDTITFSTCFQRGINAPFYTICMELDDEDKVVREFNNIEPTGDIPIVFIYSEYDLDEPYGVSLIERAGASQNMVDLMMSGHALETQKGISPPLRLAGDLDDPDFELDSIRYEPDAIWLTGGVDVGKVELNSSIYSQLPNSISMYKTNIMNQQGTTDATTSGSSSGNPMYSKTTAGVKHQENRTDIRDAAVRLNVDSFVSRLAKIMMNITLRNFEGEKVIEITKDQHEKLKAKGMELPNGKMEILIEFDELRKGEFDFAVVPGSSVAKNDNETKDRTLETIKTLSEIPDLEMKLAEEGKELRMSELIMSYLSVSGIENYEKIMVDISQEKQDRLLSGTSNIPEEELLAADIDSSNAIQKNRLEFIENLRNEGWLDGDIEEYLRMEDS